MSMKNAACRGMPARIFFPETNSMNETRLAKSICAGCPVREECRELGKTERFGIWGGVAARVRYNGGTNESRDRKLKDRKLQIVR